MGSRRWGRLEFARMLAVLASAGVAASALPLHNAFSNEDDTLASYILRLRLEACLRELQPSGLEARPITDIALSWGFNNLSHFSRVFRKYFGVVPSSIHKAQHHAPSPDAS